MRKIDLIVVHCSATRENQSYTVRQLIRDHTNRFGFTGYHYYVTRDGTVYQTPIILGVPIFLFFVFL